MTTKLEELNAVATKGIWGQYALSCGPFQEDAKAQYLLVGSLINLDTTHHMSTVQNGKRKRLSEWKHADDAAFAEALVNAYRAGELVEIKTEKIND